MLLSMFFTFKKSKNKKTAYHNAPPAFGERLCFVYTFYINKVKKTGRWLVKFASCTDNSAS